MKKLILLLFIIPQLSWGQLDGYLTPGPDGHLKVPSLTTAQILAINLPREGMQAYDVTEHCMKYYNGVSWVCCCSASASGSLTMPSSCVAWKNGDASTSEVPVTAKSDLNGNILALIYDGTLLKLKKFTFDGTLTWERTICTADEKNGFLKVLNDNSIIVVATGSNFISASSTSYGYGSYKAVINESGTPTSTIALGSLTIQLGLIRPNSDYGSDIDFDSDGNIIIVGNFAGPKTLGSSITLLTEFELMPYNSYKQEHFIVKTNPTCTAVLWAYQWDSNTTDSYMSSLNNSVFDLDIDENNDVFVSCNSNITSGNCLIKKSATNTYSLAYTNKSLLMKFKNSDGVPQWLYSRSGIESGLSVSNSRTVVKTATDGVYLIGRKMVGLSSISNSYVFADKINKSTNAVTWSKEYEHTAPTNSLFTSDAILDNSGGLYLSGYIGGCLQLTSTINICSDATSNSSFADRFILKLNSVNGSYSDFKFMGQTNLNDLTKVFLTINRYGLYSSSNFSSANVVFGSTTLSTSGGSDAVFMRCY